MKVAPILFKFASYWRSLASFFKTLISIGMAGLMLFFYDNGGELNFKNFLAILKVSFLQIIKYRS